MIKKLSDLTESDLLELDLVKSNNSVGRSVLLGCTFLKGKDGNVCLTDYNVNVDDKLYRSGLFSIFSTGDFRYSETHSFMEVETLDDFKQVLA